MAKWLVERKLKKVSSRLRAVRDELRVIDEQNAHLSDEADDTRIRALVSESPMAGRDHQEAQRHADTMSAHRGELLRTVAELEQRQDALLDQLTARP